MILRSTRRVSEVLVALVFGLALLVALAGWRATQGPISVDVLTPHVEAMISRALEGMDVTIGGTAVVFDTRRGGGIRFDVTDVAVHDRSSGDKIMTIPRIDFGISARHAVIGQLAPTDVTVLDASMTVLRDERGRWTLGVAESPPMPLDVVIDWLVALSLPDDPNDPLGQLDQVRLSGWSIGVEDHLTDQRLRLPDLEVALWREGTGLGAVASSAVARDALVADLDGEISFDALARDFDVSLRFGRLEAAWLERFGVFEAIRGTPRLDTVFSGVVDAHLDSRLLPLSMTAFVAADGGRFEHELLFPEPIDFEYADMRLSMASDHSRLELDSALIDFGGPQLTASASLKAPGPLFDDGHTLTVLDDDFSIDLHLTAADVPVDLLDRYWPKPLAPNSRGWVTRSLSEGTASSAWASLGLDIGEGGERVRLSTADGEIAFDDVTVRYLDAMPTVEAVGGHARFDEERFRIALDRGAMGDITLHPSAVEISGLPRGEQEVIQIELATTGPAPAIMTLLDREPLGYARQMGIEPDALTGRAATRVVFRFPLIRELSFDDVALGVASNISGLGVTLDDGLEVRDGDFVLTATGQGVRADGTASVAGAAVDVSWRERFTGPDRGWDAVVSGTFDDAARAALGIDVTPHVSGPVDMVARIRSPAGDPRMEFDADLDFAGSRLTIALADLEKPPGEEASARVAGVLENGRLRSVEQFSVTTEDVTVTDGAIEFAADGRTPRRLTMDRLLLMGSDLEVDARLEDDLVRITVTGPRLDISRFMDDPGDLDGFGSTEDRPEDDGPGLEVGLDIRDVILADGRQLSDLRGNLVGWGGRIERAELRARVGDGEVLARRVPRQTGYQLDVWSDDAGGLLRTLGITASMAGGTFALSGITNPDSDAFEGRFEMADYTLMDAPLLARLLNTTTPMGMAETLTSDDILFNRLTADFEWTGTGGYVRNLRTAGSSIGLTADGWVSMDAGQIDVSGTVVPFYGVNQAIDRIPIIGRLLTGGEGQGLLASTYRMHGQIDDPTVTANPLAALTPGFLRNFLFEDEAEMPSFDDLIDEDGGNDRESLLSDGEPGG